MEDDGDGEYMDMGEEDEMFSSGQETVPGSKKRKGAGDKGTRLHYILSTKRCCSPVCRVKHCPQVTCSVYHKPAS